VKRAPVSVSAMFAVVTAAILGPLVMNGTAWGGSTPYKTLRTLHGRIALSTEWKSEDKDPHHAGPIKCAWEMHPARSQGKAAWVAPLSTRERDGRHRFRLRISRTDAGYIRVVFFAQHSACDTSRSSLGTASTLVWCSRPRCGPFGEARGTIPRGAYYATFVRGSEATPTMGYFPVPGCSYCDVRDVSFTFSTNEPVSARGR
jgi:hypothetical protein